MKALAKCFCRLERRLDSGAQCFAYRHPWLAFMLLFAGFPMVILLAAFAGTAVIMFPISWLLGWV